jgi:NAD+ kinase
MKKRVILLGDERKAGVRLAIEKVRSWVEEEADLVGIDLGESLDLRKAEADLVIIFGGDGSILATARRMGNRPIPSIGVNFGKFGFLTSIRARDVRTELTRVLRSDLVVEERLMLRAKIVGDGGTEEEFLALNEFFVGPSTVGRVVTIDVRVNGEYATTYRGDGLLVSTPTGSTGHSLSAGGPIVDPDLEALILTPVNPHSLTNRPLVLPPDTVVTARAEPDHSQSRATFSADGQVSRSLDFEERVEISRAAWRFPLVQSGFRTRYDVLRTRLGWSGKPPYEEDLEELG